MTHTISIVIPLAAGETAGAELLSDLRRWAVGTEILLVGTGAVPEGLRDWLEPDASRPVRWIVAQAGRARQMNAGAQAAEGNFLWFLHADTRLTDGSAEALLRSIAAEPEALHFFSLRFLHDGPTMMRLNAWGAGFRSRVLGMPFGDQGLCLSATRFRELGGFDETLPLAEDHWFVQHARRSGVQLRWTGGTIKTSARKYRERGWWKTTGGHLGFTLRNLFRRAPAVPKHEVTQ